MSSSDSRKEETVIAFEHIHTRYGKLEEAMMQSNENVNILDIA
jgi:hypothetical protein